jgi:hypothetical protein
MQGDQPNDGLQESTDVTSSKPPLGQPPNGGFPPIGILGLILEEARRQQSATENDDQLRSVPSDPNFRKLSRIAPTTADSDAENAETMPSDAPKSFSDWLAQGRRPKKSAGRSAATNISGERAARNTKPGFGRGGNYGGGGRGGDDDDYCSRRRSEEQGECLQRRDDEEYAHLDHFKGCMDRATTRWDMCNQNGGRPHPNEPRRWNPRLDEEIYFNTDR